MNYPDKLHFETAGKMCRYIERHPEVLVMYRPTDERNHTSEPRAHAHEKI